jgi:hypothetical protein
MYLVVDLEATCWESPKCRDLNEIIDIGIVICDDSFTILSSWSSLVRPTINTKLSPFCIKLTKIQQSQIDSAKPLNDVIKDFVTWFNQNFNQESQQVLWYSWGDWDVKCLNNDCERNNISFPFGEHRNLRNIYAEKRNNGNNNKCSIKQVLIKENITHINKLHRGLSDAQAAAHIARCIYLSNII